MTIVGQIIKIIQITDGPKPQMGPIPAIPLLMDVQMTGGLARLEISQSAALELVEELSKHLRVRGCL